MKFRIKNPGNLKTNHPQQDHLISAGACADEAEHASRGTECAVSGKPHGFFRPMFVISGVALCMGLTSCVVPYDSDGGGSVTVSSYSPGYRVNTLPGGYRSEMISGTTYYYHDGYYYNRGSGGYVVVDAPRSSRYYSDYSNRHRTVQTTRNYRGTSNRPGQRHERTEVITRLPSGYREVSHRGERYYQSGDRYYRRQGDSYIMVSSPF